MAKLLRCKLGFHHWHYNLTTMDLHLLVSPYCYFCRKEDSTMDVSVKDWFTFSWSSVWDYHNPAWHNLYKKRIEREHRKLID